MIDLGWFGVLDVDRDVTLTTAVDLAARGGDMDTVGHIPALKFVDQFIHHRLDDARSIGARDITVQPALCVRDEHQLSSWCHQRQNLQPPSL